ncbi:MAG: 30S ribosomal protein S18 [bacterium]
MLKKKKVNRFYEKDGPSISDIHYKNVDLLMRFVTEQGKIIPRRTSGNDARCQRLVKRAIKRARHLALMPYVMENPR